MINASVLKEHGNLDFNNNNNPSHWEVTAENSGHSDKKWTLQGHSKVYVVNAIYSGNWCIYTFFQLLTT